MKKLEEAALTAHAAVRFQLGKGTALEANAEQLYWTSIRLGERRWGFGLVLTR